MSNPNETPISTGKTPETEESTVNFPAEGQPIVDTPPVVASAQDQPEIASVQDQPVIASVQVLPAASSASVGTEDQSDQGQGTASHQELKRVESAPPTVRPHEGQVLPSADSQACGLGSRGSSDSSGSKPFVSWSPTRDTHATTRASSAYGCVGPSQGLVSQGATTEQPVSFVGQQGAASGELGSATGEGGATNEQDRPTGCMDCVNTMIDGCMNVILCASCQSKADSTPTRRAVNLVNNPLFTDTSDYHDSTTASVPSLVTDSPGRQDQTEHISGVIQEERDEDKNEDDDAHDSSKRPKKDSTD